MKNKQNIPATVRVSCRKCGMTETVQLTTVEDYSYTDDILNEMGWNDRVCPTCQELSRIEKKKKR